MKLCKDCNHFIRNEQEAFCECSEVITVSPVTGKSKCTYCTVERVDPFGAGGRDGKLFEPRLEAA